MESKIVKFIGRHHVMTLATVGEDGAPYCSNAFYSYDKEREVLIFTSNLDTCHGGHMIKNPTVAASIVLETKVVGKLQGLQLTGRVYEGSDEDKRCYISTYPFAAAAPLTIWRFEPHFIKLTDNTLGFGKKLIWKRE